MPALTITSEITISAEPTDVAGVMFDPAREPEWIDAVKTVDVIDPSIRPGARVKRTAEVKGFHVQWTTEVESFHFPHMLTLRIAEDQFKGTLQYHVGRSGSGSIARVSIAGDAKVPMFLPTSLITDGVRKALDGYLARLKTIIETPAAIA